MTTGLTPYETPNPSDTDPAANVLETVLIARHQTVNLGGGLMANAETFNGAIPGPTLRFNVGDTAIVRLINELDHPTGIHWHGIELANSVDGTEVTQEAVVPAFPTPPPPPAPIGGTYLYKFELPRPGLYWYHPHHHLSTNRVFRGMYGMIVVADPNEAALIAGNVIPGSADTEQLVLSDITVCKAPLSNDTANYEDPTLLPLADRPEWLSGATSQPAPTPVNLCDIGASGATNDDGTTAAVAYAAGDVPSMVRPPGRLNEGQTVLTNGVNVGARLGTPAAPGALAVGAQLRDVLSGQGLRLQIVNCAIIRHFRLILTTSTGVQVPLVRIGGEGGLLDNAVVEGGTIGTYNTKYTSGEVMVPPASRVDVVAAIPPGLPVGSVLTLWTRDFQRVGGGANWAELPTVPVMHLNVTGAAPATYTIPAGTALRASIPGAAVEVLPPPTGTLLNPATFVPAKPGLSNQDIQITTPPGINGVIGNFEGFTPYTSAPHIGSSRYAEDGRTLELSITNTSPAHHPFHLHGFSFQPKSLAPRVGAPGGVVGSFTWPYQEFRDNIDVPGNYTLTFRVRLDDRPLVDGVTMGGSLGRWLFHCHIFFHHHQGMISEFVVTAADGSEKPNVDVGGSWTYTPAGGIARRKGTYNHPDGDAVTLTATIGNLSFPAPGQWEWELDSTGLPNQTQYVYVTAEDPAGRRDQTVFRLKIGAPDDGADNGDPHIHTVDGKRYDFQAVGEFILLRDREGMEIQARQWPVETAGPITDPYTGLKSCVSVNTAVAARVGSHRIAYQPVREGSWFQLTIDGKPAKLPFEGIDLDAHRVTAVAVPGGGTALRVDYAHSPVLTITPWFWSSYNIWLLNVSVAHTDAEEGVMGRIPEDTWLPALPTGATVGPMPKSLQDRYIVLYRTFADAWRVTDETSLFVYERGTSTKTFTDTDWPAAKPPCKLKPEFEVPGAEPSATGIPIEKAQQICQAVTVDGLHRDCVFDVATTGDPDLAKMYEVLQEVRRRACAIQIVSNKAKTRRGEPVEITATVLPLMRDCEKPTGTVTFLVGGKPLGPPVKLDDHGRARIKTDALPRGSHKIRAVHASHGKKRGDTCSSPTLVHTVIDPKAGHATIRRVLRFLNAARSREDLVLTPAREVPLIDERQEHGIHLDEPHGHGPAPAAVHGGGGHAAHGGGGHMMPARVDHVGDHHGKRRPLFDRHTADHVFSDRLAKAPIYGFATIEDVLAVRHFDPALLDHIFTLIGPATYGEWEVLYSGAGTPFEVAHAALLKNGKVLFIPESFAATDTLIWDPADPNHATALRTLSGAMTGLTGVLFCGGHSFLQDGKLLAVGGGTSALGTTAAWKFDPDAETWQATSGAMGAARWYPTTVVLGEDAGRVLVVDGGPASMEIYSETTDSFEPVHGPAGPLDPAADRAFPQLYPGLHLLPTGQIFFTRTGNNSGTAPAAYFTFATPTSGSWTGLTGGSAGEDRGRGMSLMMLRQQPTDPDRILVIGGGSGGTPATVGLIDNPPSAAAWLSAAIPDGLARSSVNGVLLPDGTALICGGRPTGGTPPNGGACYLYQPAAGLGIGAFSEMDEVAYARQYHSVAILLPSAQVMITGGGNNTIEVFSPPYLYNPDGTLASRPEIDTYPDPSVGTTVLHGSSFDIGTMQAPDIAKVVMVRPMAVTHQTDSEQRVLSLSFSHTSPTTLTVTAPDGRIFPYGGGGGHTHVTAPRGYYLLFIIDGNGVPSQAKFVRLV